MSLFGVSEITDDTKIHQNANKIAKKMEKSLPNKRKYILLPPKTNKAVMYNTSASFFSNFFFVFTWRR